MYSQQIFRGIFNMATGSVKWFNDSKGYGFIEHDDTGSEIFVHYTAIQGEGFKSLAEGQRVKFEMIDGPAGTLAANVLTHQP